MKGEIELIFSYEDWNSASDVIESLKEINNDDFLMNLYCSTFDEKIRKNTTYTEPKLMYNWGKESLTISFDW
jgi:hypothetical protein